MIAIIAATLVVAGLLHILELFFCDKICYDAHYSSTYPYDHDYIDIDSFKYEGATYEECLIACAGKRNFVMVIWYVPSIATGTLYC